MLEIITEIVERYETEELESSGQLYVHVSSRALKDGSIFRSFNVIAGKIPSVNFKFHVRERNYP